MLTPLDIEAKKFSSSVGGYNKTEVRRFIREIIQSYEVIYKENIEMKDKISMLNDGIQYYKTIEDTLQKTLLLAEKTAEETRMSARNRADTIEKEAELTASKIIKEAKEEIYHINQMRETMIKAYDASKIQIRQFLKAQLEMVERNELELEQHSGIVNELINNVNAVDEEPYIKNVETE